MSLLIFLALAAQKEVKKVELPVELDKDRIPSIVTKGSCLIKGGTLLTVSHGTMVDTDILVKDGKIASIGKHLTAPDGTVVINAAGKIVSPGLVDAHTHIASDAINEGADSITPECRIEDVLNSQGIGLYHKLAAGNTSSLTLHGSANPIGGESKIIKHKWKRPVQELIFPGAPRVVKFALGENVTRANSSNSTRFPGTRMGVEAVYRRAFNEARNYMQAQKDGLHPRKDVRLEALSDMLKGNIIIHCHCYRQDEMLSLMKVCKEYGVRLVAFQHALEGYKIAPELAAQGIGTSIFVDQWDYKIEAHDTTPYGAAIMRKAGVIVSVNTDSGSGVTPFQLDAAKTMRFGAMSPDEALKMVTLYPAKELFIDQKVGSLDVGKDADIAIWDGHPLSVYSRCAMTLVDGDVMFQRRDAFGLDKTSVLKSEVRTVTDAPVPKLSLPKSSTYAIVHATIHTMASAEIKNGTLVVRDGRIVAVGNIKPPKDAVIVDAKGKHVYPGLIDAGTDLGRVEFGSTKTTDDNSDHGDFQPDLKGISAINPESDRIPVARIAGLTTVMSAPSGGMIPGQSALINLDGYTFDQMALRSVAALNVDYPEGFGAFNDFMRAQLSPEDLASFRESGNQKLETLEDQFEKAKRYAILRSEKPETPVDLRMEAMVPYATGKALVVFKASSPSAVKGVVGFCERLGLKGILAGGKEVWKSAEFLASKKFPVLLQLPIWSAPDAGGECAPAKDYDPYDSAFTAPAILARAGVPFAFQSGSSEGTYNLPYRAGHACAFGLPYDKALEAMTIGAARILGIGDEVGSLEAGKLANFIITDGDPLEITTQVSQMFIKGKPVSLESRWSWEYEKYIERVK